MYSFAQRPDTCVVDEPLYGRHPLFEHPLAVAVEAQRERLKPKTVQVLVFGVYQYLLNAA